MRYADLLILEANYNQQLLLNGPYPRSVKRRIMSAHGHLSNAQAARAVLKAWSTYGKRTLWLAHLSATNNTPALAIDHIRAHLQNAGVDLSQMTIRALPPDMGEVWDSTKLWHNLL
jgi:phosphoribosyl 1,2-cyclic phosphodiesterase